MNLRQFQTVRERREALEKELKLKLTHTSHSSMDEGTAPTGNCENMIGVTQVPLGIAGPLTINAKCQMTNDKWESKEYYLPLATTEGALVASVNRGCKAISASGGATVDSYRAGATRGPVFKVRDLEESDRLNSYLEAHFDDLKKIAGGTSRHLTLKKYLDRGVGRYRYVRFVFDTGEAMGMNMVTIATKAIVDEIEKQTGTHCVCLAGNYDTDKKPSWLNVIEGRGVKAWAEVSLTEKVLRETLKTTAQKVYDVWLAKCMIGSAMSGSMGFNSHFANVTAALFLATGQDIAHVAESSLGITTCEVIRPASFRPPGRNPSSKKLIPGPSASAGRQARDDKTGEGLYVSVYLPDLMVGTVGGGTGLATQKEALEILGVKSTDRFAGIIAGAVLAGEISLLSSLAEGTLARAHQRLGRGMLNTTNTTNKQIYK